VDDHCHDPEGTRFVGAVEDLLFEGTTIREPWVGVLHQAPRTTAPHFPDLYRLLKMPEWQASIHHCRGLYVLCEYARDFLRVWNVPVPICVLPYPVQEPQLKFSWNDYVGASTRHLVFIGEYQRDYSSFFKLEAPGHIKILLKTPDNAAEVDALNPLGTVLVRDRLPEDEYDALLASSIVFLRLFDAVAITTVMECIVRGTPIILNRAPALFEFLQEDYPLFYDTLGEATALLGDRVALKRGSEHLQSLPIRDRLGDQSFLRSLRDSAIYRSLPIPPDQQSNHFKTLDLTICVCSYDRVEDLAGLLARLADQDFPGTFEVILWNNNSTKSREVDAIAESLSGKLLLRVIHSSENYYCIVRLAVASLMRSELLLICDDDCLPERQYVSRFMERYRRYGPKAVVCARGHVFDDHELDEEHPATRWEEHEFAFYDEAAEDRRVHFLHADNCLIPRTLLRRLGTHDLERLEVELVDDYWFSYLLGVMEVPVWKIRADDVLSFTESAEDETKALYHNPKVHEERVAFYINHMRIGWPSFKSGDVSIANLDEHGNT
tara:strand:- start:6305 stop:7954 length:1650 start_codon:yes stop_codon:yes gene_type:complete